MKENDNLVESAKITSKGQITIPKKIRELLDLNDGEPKLLITVATILLLRSLPLSFM